MAGENTFLETDGKSVPVSLSYTVDANRVALVEGFLGVTARSGDSGDTVALTMDQREYQFTVPTSLDVAKGDKVYIIVANVTGTHIPPDNAYTKTPGSNLALFKATSDQDGNDVVTGILIGG